MHPNPSMEDLFTQALDPSKDPNAGWQAIIQLHALASQQVFDKAAICCTSSDPWIRARGVDILSQLRISREQPTHPFEQQAFDVITSLLLIEQDEEPLAAAITALGHIGNPEGIDHCIRFLQHPSSEIRFSVAFALGSFSNHMPAVEALLQLMTDEEARVRDWATFGLGVLGDLDSPKIREALLLRITDPDRDTREEAISGLARRQDRRVIPILQELLRQPQISPCIEEAANCFPEMQAT
jgi:HEAT repeat protein